MSGETNDFSIRNEVTHSDNSFLRGASESSLTTSSNDTEILEPSDFSSTNLCSVILKPQCTSTPEKQSPTSDIHFQNTTTLPVTAWPMFLEKYLEQSREISKRLQFPPSSNVDDNSALVESSFGKSTKVKTRTMVTSSSPENVTASETKYLPKSKFVMPQIKKKEDTMKNEQLTSTEKKSSRKKVVKEENSMKGQSQISTRRHELKCTITAPLQKNKLALTEKAELALSVQDNSVTTASSLNSANCLPKKRHYSFSSNPPEDEFSKKKGK